MFNVVDFCGGKKWRVIVWGCILCVGTIDGAVPWMWCILFFGRRGVLEFVERCCNVARH